MDELPALYLVGGTVRDILMDRVPKDYDLTCRNAKALANLLSSRKHAALVSMEKITNVPCYRVVDRSDQRNYLDIVELRGSSIINDLHQRDFTINAIAMEITTDGSTGAIIDPLNGASDISARIIRAIDDKIFIADPVRILRAFRLAASLEFGIEASTIESLRNHAKRLSSASGERVMSEILLLLETSNSVVFFRQMGELDILDILFPEMKLTKGCYQNECHYFDAWGHSLSVMENCENILNSLLDYFGQWSTDIIKHLSSGNRFQLLKLAVLLHALWNPEAQGSNPATGRTFCENDIKPGQIVWTICDRLRLSKQSKAFLALIVSTHLNILHLTYDAPLSHAWLRLTKKLDSEIIPAIIFGIADLQTSYGQSMVGVDRDERIKLLKNFVGNFYSVIKPRLELPNLISGEDLLRLGIKPGPVLGKMLQQLRMAQDEGELTDRLTAMNAAKKLTEDTKK